MAKLTSRKMRTVRSMVALLFSSLLLNVARNPSLMLLTFKVVNFTRTGQFFVPGPIS